MNTLTLDQFWRCPQCGTGYGTGLPATITKPPICNMGHARTEMEQTNAEGFNADLQDTFKVQREDDE